MLKAKETPRKSSPTHPKLTNPMSVTTANGNVARAKLENQADALLEQYQKFAVDERRRVLASLRENVRGIPAERHDEMFADFAKAAETRDIGYLADTILNWALGGHGYDYTGEAINRLEPIVTAADSDEDKAIWEEIRAGGSQ